MPTNNPNYFKTEGVLFSKPVRVVKSKKDGKEYEFKSIILEIKREHKGKVYRELPEFQLGYGVTIDDFEIGDRIFVNFSLSGKEISASFHKTELKAIYIGHSDLQIGSDMRDTSGEPAWKKKEIPSPQEIEEYDSDEELPF